jgi:hypothetical protein
MTVITFTFQSAKDQVDKTILTVILYGHETWSLSLREKLQKVHGKMFGPEKVEVSN